jgi:hypothetical protein
VVASNMALQRTRRPRLRSGRSLRSLGSPLNAYPLGGCANQERGPLPLAGFLVLAILASGCNDTSNILTIATPAQVLSFQVAPRDGPPVWRIEASAPQKIERLQYGQVPAGFRQVMPEPPAAPRPLKNGEVLMTTTVEPDREFTHECQAVGVTGLTCGGWESRPSIRPTVKGK